MKTLIASFLLVCAASVSSFAQSFDIATYNGWFIENKSAVWQKVYMDSTITPNVMIAHLKKFSWLKAIEESQGTIYAIALDYRMDFRKYKFSLDIPEIFKSSTWNWSMAIDFKPGKYRVTITSITYSPDDRYAYPGVQSAENLVYEDEVMNRRRTSFREASLRNLRSLARDLNGIYTVGDWQSKATEVW